MDKIYAEKIVLCIRKKMEWISEKSKDKIPYTTENGVHNDLSEKDIGWWTNGFWSGMMWLMYQETKENRYAEIARKTEDKLDECLKQFYCLHHDIGFMWLLTAVADYKLTGNPEAKRRGLLAANLLAGRFNPAGNFIRAWNSWENGEDNSGWVIIDCMMNLSLLYWASEESKDPRYRKIAMLHADTVARNFIRKDGSVRHIVVFDPDTGEMIEELGGQGYQKGSSWTRGQTWALYGFVISWLHTKKSEYLQMAEKVAEYFISQIPENGRIPVDFCQPGDVSLEDSSASAIAASAFLELARIFDGEKSGKYQKIAERLLEVLCEQRCNWTKDCDCILEKCTAAYHNQVKETNIIYGDYFFMEAVLKYHGNSNLFW